MSVKKDSSKPSKDSSKESGSSTLRGLLYEEKPKPDETIKGFSLGK